MTEKAERQDDASRRKLRIGLIAASILYPASLAVWFVVYMIVFMGGAALPMYVLMTYPAVAVASLIGGWIFYRRRRDRAAWWSLALPLIHILIFVLVMAIFIVGTRLSQG